MMVALDLDLWGGGGLPGQRDERGSVLMDETETDVLRTVNDDGHQQRCLRCLHVDTKGIPAASQRNECTHAVVGMDACAVDTYTLLTTPPPESRNYTQSNKLSGHLLSPSTKRRDPTPRHFIIALFILTSYPPLPTRDPRHFKPSLNTAHQRHDHLQTSLLLRR